MNDHRRPPEFSRRRFLQVLGLGASAVAGKAIVSEGRSGPLQNAENGAAPGREPRKGWVLRYRQAAPDTLEGWEQSSLPLGNGHMGVNVFGGVEQERLQLTDKTFWMNDASKAGTAYDRRCLGNLAETRILFPTLEGVTDYERELNLATAQVTIRYRAQGVDYVRQAFASFPDRVFALRLTASAPGKVSFTLKPTIPFLGEFRQGVVAAQGNRITLRGESAPFRCRYEGQFIVLPQGGELQARNRDGQAAIEVSGADSAVILIATGTNYQLKPQCFLAENGEKLAGFPLPHARVAQTLDRAAARTWDSLYAAHLADYQPLFSRVELELGDSSDGRPTDQLLQRYKTAPGNRYLEALYFQYGRYLLIASSRAGTMPANLQGTWNAKQAAPWTGGYWANINVEMNYWPCFNANLKECYGPLMDLLEAMRPCQREIAREMVQRYHPEALADDCGWTAGTGNSPYRCAGPGKTSGFGTGSFLALNMWEYYAFTRDIGVLRRIWPFLRDSSLFTSKIVKRQPGYGDLLLCFPSWSPENPDRQNSDPARRKDKVNLPGTTYDQSLIYEGHQRAIEAAEILGIRDPLIETLRKQLPLLDPIQIGDSGQIKEFRQEKRYGEFGDPKHRHISHLVGLFPGHLISNRTPRWLAAAKVALTHRGDQSTGWAMAHRLNAWARIQDSEHAYSLLQLLLKISTLGNLWDSCPPFQIDGNLGGTAGIAEMLLQSQAGYIELLPACPKHWDTGRFKGLVARGAFEISARWTDHQLAAVEIRSQEGGECRVKFPGASAWQVRRKGDGKTVPTVAGQAGDLLSFSTEKNAAYELRRG